MSTVDAVSSPPSRPTPTLFDYRGVGGGEEGGPCSDEERAARAALAAAVEPGSVNIARKTQDIGPQATLALLRRGAGGQLDKDGRVQRRLVGVDGEELLRRTAAVGARFVCPGDPEWPPRIEELVYALEAPRAVPPPFGLWLRGSADLVELTGDRSVAIVGARAATEYGMTVAADLAADLALAGWIVVSGAAYGIDASAHRGALAVNRPTVAVLACGVDVPYPRSHASLLQRILVDGLLLSERPPGTNPTRKGFLKRNRLIAALTRGTVVVEAALRSGALSTAEWAAHLSREVASVPGPVTSALSDGCHKLIRDGKAVLATSAAEVADVIGELGADAAEERRSPDGPLDLLEDTHRDVIEAMPGHGTTSVDELCGTTGLSVPVCMAALASLAAAGWVVGSDYGWQLADPPSDGG